MDDRVSGQVDVVRRAWADYVHALKETGRAAERLGAVPGGALRSSAPSDILMGYLLCWAPPEVRAAFLDRLLEETLVDTYLARPSVAAIGSVDTPAVRGYLPAFAGRLLRAESQERYAGAVHMLWLYGEFVAVRGILMAWRADRLDEDEDEFWDDYLDTFEDRYPMPAVAESEVRAWLSSARERAGATADVSVPGFAPASAVGTQVALLWDDLRKSSKALSAAHRRVLGAGLEEVFRYALSVPGQQMYVVRLLDISYQGLEKMTAAADLIGADFYPVYFPLMLELAASDVSAAISLLSVLRTIAGEAGQDEWARMTVDVERAVYGTFDKNGRLIRIRD